MAKLTGYCMKCKAKREMDGVKPYKMGPRKTDAAKGTCIKCGTKMNKILSESDKKLV